MGRIDIIDKFYSPLDKFNRTLRIYTPDSYDSSPHRHYPVIYMTDGQNVYAHPKSARFETWCVNRTLEKLVQTGELEREWIVCAIDHEIDRFAEYTPWPYPEASVWDPHGRKFLNNLTEFFIPWMNAHYRTLTGPQNTAFIGSSLGGLMALFCGRERPDVIGRIGAVSPSLTWSRRKTFEHWDSKLDFGTRIYMDMGSLEISTHNGEQTDYTQILTEFHAHLKSLGYTDDELFMYIDKGGIHFEESWANRFHIIAKTLLNDHHDIEPGQ